MNDSQLLRLAANVADIEFTWKHCRFYTGLPDMYGVRELVDEMTPFLSWGLFWNPLRNDGDALRLASKLGIEIEFTQDLRSVYAGVRGTAKWKEEVGTGQDIYASTRRAIVNAAIQSHYAGVSRP